ncbi:hypothetical protein PI124_g9111 [Phytophthora idaei]|nr:hypothetical protein PI125_g15196 [Phytophthora idaei]KAG3151550.1 hypothetical protein PI126_g10938 [Phytophthora idaei]KAG3246154.1 hypothetical protein PI124_g9111 [Phytophthora idaei]
MCPYYKRKGGIMTLVGVYVDDLLVIAPRPSLVEEFFASMSVLSVKDLGRGQEVSGDARGAGR